MRIVYQKISPQASNYSETLAQQNLPLYDMLINTTETNNPPTQNGV